MPLSQGFTAEDKECLRRTLQSGSTEPELFPSPQATPEKLQAPCPSPADPTPESEIGRFSAPACAFPPRPETSSPPSTMPLCPVAAGDRANPEAGFSRPLLIATGHRVSPLVVVSKTPLPALCPRLRPCEGEGHRTGGEVQMFNKQQQEERHMSSMVPVGQFPISGKAQVSAEKPGSKEEGAI